MATIKQTISAFIRDHAHGDGLVVCTGYVSVKGLAWLAGQAPANQRITIIIGDMRPNSLAKATDEDRRSAARFLTRENVEVHTWYRTRPVKRMAHGKAVAAINNGRVVSALVGSANLTEKGLSDNLELMVPCGSEGLPSVNEYITEATSHPSVKAKLLSDIALRGPSGRTRKPVQAAGSGCAAVLLMLPFRAIMGSVRSSVRALRPRVSR